MGYMGCGKSFIGNELSLVSGFDFLDLDDYIQEQEGQSISRIFERKGALYFRKKETYYLKEVVAARDNMILSLGGGTPCFSGNLEILQQSRDTKSVYLQASRSVLTQRLFKEREKRPLISHIHTLEELDDFIRKHLFERSFYYNQADYKVQTDEKTPEEIVIEIKEKLF